MKRFDTRQITMAAMVAALYFVLCYFGNIFRLTFGPVQVRLGEALTVLPFLFPAAAPGVALGSPPMAPSTWWWALSPPPSPPSGP